jgi:hypothetical protein
MDNGGMVSRGNDNRREIIDRGINRERDNRVEVILYTGGIIHIGVIGTEQRRRAKRGRNKGRETS